MNKQSEQVKDFFHDYSKNFDSIYGHTTNRSSIERWIDRKFRKTMFLRFEETLKNITNPDICSIIDVGCGPGRYCYEFLIQQKKVLAIDFAPSMIDIAKNVTSNLGHENIQFIIGDYKNVNLSEKYDAACLMGLFDYIKDPIPFIKKLCNDITKEIYASFPKDGGWMSWQRKIRYKLRKCPLYLYSKDNLCGILHQVGLQNKYTIKDFGRDWYVKIKI